MLGKIISGRGYRKHGSSDEHRGCWYGWRIKGKDKIRGGEMGWQSRALLVLLNFSWFS